MIAAIALHTNMGKTTGKKNTLEGREKLKTN